MRIPRPRRLWRTWGEYRAPAGARNPNELCLHLRGHGRRAPLPLLSGTRQFAGHVCLSSRAFVDGHRGAYERLGHRDGDRFGHFSQLGLPPPIAGLLPTLALRLTRSAPSQVTRASPCPPLRGCEPGVHRREPRQCHGLLGVPCSRVVRHGERDSAIAVYDDQGQQWNVLADLLLQQRCAARLRAGDRIQRIGLLAVWRWPIRHGTGTGHRFSGPLPHRKRDRRQHRARLARSYSDHRSGVNQVRNLLAAAGGVDPERWIRSANRRRSLSAPVSSRHRRRLRHDGRARSRNQ